MKEEIKVSYNGRYPNSCSGTLKIWVEDKLIYNKKFCCRSTGSVWFDDSWDEHVEEGELIWEDANLGDANLRDADFYHTKFYGKGGTTKIKKEQIDDFLKALGIIVEI